MSTKTHDGTKSATIEEFEEVLAALEERLEPVLKPLKKSVRDLIWENIYEAFDVIQDMLEDISVEIVPDNTSPKSDDEVIARIPQGDAFPSAKDLLYTA